MPSKDLTDFIEQVTGESHLRVENDLGDGFVVLKVSEAERRQARHDIRSSEDIVIEMLRNARDAGAKHIFVATSKEGTCRRITMLDDGSGIPEHLQDRIFDARVTSKLDTMHIDTWGVHGRGMALYAVRMNTKVAYVCASVQGGGSSFVVESDTNILPERVDQSSFPMFIRNDAGKIVVRGARNINRTVAEFAFVDKDNCSVFLGSPTEIAATLYEFGKLSHLNNTHNPLEIYDKAAVCKRLALAHTPDVFQTIAQGIGLSMSSRSARRILDGEIHGLSSLAETIQITSNDKDKASSPKKKSSASGYQAKDERGLTLAQEDVWALENGVSKLFVPLAQAYYLEQSVQPSVSLRKDGIHIFIPTIKIR